MESIWNTEILPPQCAEFLPDATVDIAVIGGGMAGILTAYFLKQQGRDVVVLEAGKVAHGQTGGTTAKITSQHGLIFDWLIKKYGVEQARLYAKANEHAIRMYAKLVEKHSIECDFKRLPAFLYSEKQKDVLVREAKAAASLGLPASFVEQTALPFPVAGAVCFENQAQFHPLKFIEALAKELTIYEQTMVRRVKGHTLFTDRGRLFAKHIVFAVHYPFTVWRGFYYMRQHQERSYVVAYQGAGQLDGMYYGIDKDSLSLRSYGDVLLAGGGNHRTGWNEDGGSYASIRKKVAALFPDAQEIACWSAQDCMPHDRLPFIGRYSAFRPYWYVATGFQKWGMTTSMISALLLCDTICGIDNPYRKMFTPGRLHPVASAGSFFTDLWTSAKGLLGGYHFFTCAKEEDLQNGQGGIVRKGLFRYGCYRDENGGLYRISLRCPHMGCELLWNPDEKSWDCPCHGSRFRYDGRLLDNPARSGK